MTSAFGTIRTISLSGASKSDHSGSYHLSLFAATLADSPIQIKVGDKTMMATAPNTGDWSKFRETDLGMVELYAGTVEISVRANDSATWKPINLSWLKLTPDR